MTEISFSVYGKMGDVKPFFEIWKSNLECEIRDINPPQGHGLLICRFVEEFPSTNLEFSEILKLFNCDYIKILRKESIVFSMHIFLNEGGACNIPKSVVRQIGDAGFDLIIATPETIEL